MNDYSAQLDRLRERLEQVERPLMTSSTAEEYLEQHLASLIGL